MPQARWERLGQQRQVVNVDAAAADTAAPPADPATLAAPTTDTAKSAAEVADALFVGIHRRT